ncbi:hypothetical protein [Piscinibacter defluvii]|uniref:hypothetical protein n=1 Tax=Piscinibacter defluvii TaxID=1796922 RepID=UPI000FDE1C3F|nr:hypothetical protein [Piscinibacter defluvii]
MLFNDDERDLRIQFGDMVTDAEGRDCMVGLTHEESVFLVQHKRDFAKGNRHHGEAKRRAVELVRKHEAARIARLGEVHAQTSDAVDRARGKG